MQILVTDATGAVGRSVTRQLIAAGHTVSGIAQHPHDALDPRVDYVCASLRNPVLQELAGEADAVIHLAPVDTSAPGGVGITGLAHVANAAARAGARLLFVSQAAGRPELYRQAETLVSTGWAPSLVIRIAPPVGRQLDWMVCRTVATLLRSKVSARPIRVLHLDDLVRFLVLALNTDRNGVVDLATPDTTNVVTAWRLLRSVDPHLRTRRVRSWEQLIPEVDIAAVQEDWNFEFGWQATEAIVDTGRGLVGRRLHPAGATRPPTAVRRGCPVLRPMVSSMVIGSCRPIGLTTNRCTRWTNSRLRFIAAFNATDLAAASRWCPDRAEPPQLCHVPR